MKRPFLFSVFILISFSLVACVATKKNQSMTSGVADDAADATSSTATPTPTPTPSAQAATLSASVLLEGAWQFYQGNTFDRSNMFDAGSGCVQFTAGHPFSSAPISYSGSEVMSSTAITAFQASSIVGWVLFRFRDPANLASVVYQVPGLVRAGGSVVNPTDLGPLELSGLSTGSYRVSVLAPGHLEILSSETLSFSAGQTTSYDFTNPVKVDGALNVNFVQRSGKSLLAAGDVNQDGAIDFLDQSLLDNDNNAFVCGYKASTDQNLDTYVDGNDLTDYNNNSTNGLIRSF